MTQRKSVGLRCGRAIRRWVLGIVGIAALVASAGAIAAPKDQKKKGARVDAKFVARLAALKSSHEIIRVAMQPTDEPDAVAPARSQGGYVVVAAPKRQIYTPAILTPDDILGVIQEQMPSIRKCYKQQLAAEPEFNEEVILDLSVRKTGRVAAVSVAPRYVARAELGRCLVREVPKWRFPPFTGEGEDGIAQDVVSASFPFAFSRTPEK